MADLERDCFCIVIKGGNYSHLFNILGVINVGYWIGGSYENIMREGKNSLYYVDAEYNGAQTDMPFSYCVIFTLIRKQDNVSDNNQGMAFAFDVTTGDLKFKCFGGTTGDRNYPWKTISLT